MKKLLAIGLTVVALTGCSLATSGYKALVSPGCDGISSKPISGEEYSKIRDTFGKPVRIDVQGNNEVVETYKKGYTKLSLKKSGNGDIEIVTCSHRE